MARLRSTVKQYNSVITWETEGTPSHQDDDGNIIPGVPGEVVSAECRYENFKESNRREFLGRGGKTVFATGKVFIKFGEPMPPRFVVAEIATNGEVIYKGEVVNTFEGQMNKTIYTVEDVRI